MKSKRPIVAEVTYRVRELAGMGFLASNLGAGPLTDHKEWSIESLKSRLEGKWVSFRGCLFYDPDHATGGWREDPEDDGVPGLQGNEQNWRLTGWEIHPVTAIKVLAGPP